MFHDFHFSSALHPWRFAPVDPWRRGPFFTSSAKVVLAPNVTGRVIDIVTRPERLRLLHLIPVVAGAAAPTSGGFIELRADGTLVGEYRCDIQYQQFDRSIMLDDEIGPAKRLTLDYTNIDPASTERAIFYLVGYYRHLQGGDL